VRAENVLKETKHKNRVQTNVLTVTLI